MTLSILILSIMVLSIMGVITILSVEGVMINVLSSNVIILAVVMLTVVMLAVGAPLNFHLVGIVSTSNKFFFQKLKKKIVHLSNCVNFITQTNPF